MRLRYLSRATVESLQTNVGVNVERYVSGDFAGVAGEWNLELSLDVDLSPLSDLDPTVISDAEVRNSELVWRALHNLSPALAYEEGIWTRLTHVECLEFARSRWLRNVNDEEKAAAAIGLHFFAGSLTQRRDDNAVSRLWWNAYIANSASPSDRLGALKAILRTADIRSNIVERSQTGSRRKLCGGLVRFIHAVPAVTATEQSFRTFMKEVNRQGGGAIFEAMSEAQIDDFLQRCWQSGGTGLSRTAAQ